MLLPTVRASIVCTVATQQYAARMTGQRDVISNLLKLSTKLNIPAQGQHVLKVWMADPGLIIDKIIIDTGGVKESYLGPPESVFYDN